MKLSTGLKGRLNKIKSKVNNDFDRPYRSVPNLSKNSRDSRVVKKQSKKSSLRVRNTNVKEVRLPTIISYDNVKKGKYSNYKYCTPSDAKEVGSESLKDKISEILTNSKKEKKLCLTANKQYLHLSSQCKINKCYSFKALSGVNLPTISIERVINNRNIIRAFILIFDPKYQKERAKWLHKIRLLHQDNWNAYLLEKSF